MVAELKGLRPALYFCSPQDIKGVVISTFSDPSNGTADEICGQRGGIFRLLLHGGQQAELLFHLISCTINNQRSVLYSSFGAEILAASNADDRGYDLNLSFSRYSLINLSLPLIHKNIFDSKALFETLTTLHQTDDYSLLRTVSRIRASFESKKLNIMRWIPAVVNVADAIGKSN